jgi:23S rRNA (cytosine1962-C5)-methyltransferase
MPHLFAPAEDGRQANETTATPQARKADSRLSAASKNGEEKERQGRTMTVPRESGRRNHALLARECENLDPAEEKAMAEEGMAFELAMWPPYDGCQLLDFGDGRRLEQFGDMVLDRPCPAAESFQRARPEMWKEADTRFAGRENEKGQWTDRRELPERWTISHGPLQFELKRTDFGHLGLFPEQAENWTWITESIRRLECGDSSPLSFAKRSKLENDLSPHDESGDESPHPRRPKILNLFAYTGGSTLAAAAAGAEVVHVDAAKNIVAWARRNAELSGLAQASIRWIVEDAVKFVKRELKRGNRYDAMILDPPSYGHGPRGEVWRLSKHLPRLLSLCGELTGGRPKFMLLTCHTPGYEAERLAEMLREHCLPDMPASSGQMEAGLLSLRAADGRQLPSGVAVRWRQDG